MNVALIGPSGAGKGTHAAALVSRFNLLHLCTGDLFRENVENQSALGLLARKYIGRGEMVPDEVVDAMIEERLRRLPEDCGVLFDGFPRTVYQARFLDELLKQLDRRLDAVLYLDVADEEIQNRISGREVCHKCRASFRRIYHPFVECPEHRCHGEHLYRRPDDTAQTTLARLRAFHRVTGPVIEFYQRTNRCGIVDGEAEVDSVRQALLDRLQSIKSDKFFPSTCAEIGMLLTRVTRPVPPSRPPVTLDLILIGAPGSGKGTQAATLAHDLGLPHIATGDLFRQNLKDQTELGKLARGYMDRGELVPDDVTDAMVQERLSRSDARDGFILDGFPRTVHQAESLAEILADLHRTVAGAIYLKVPDQEIVGRLSARWICRNCQAPYHAQFKPPQTAGFCDACAGPLYQRDDDKAETVMTRLRTFHQQTEPVVRFYKEAGLLTEVEATGAVAAVGRRIADAARGIQEQLRDNRGSARIIQDLPPVPLGTADAAPVS